MVTGTVLATRQSMEKAIAEQDRSKMPDKTESAVDSPCPAWSRKSNFNRIRGFKTAKRVNGVSAPLLQGASPAPRDALSFERIYCQNPQCQLTKK